MRGDHLLRFLVRKLEFLFRHIFVYPILRLFFRNPQENEPIDLTEVKKILILRYDKIGDIIVTTPVLRVLKQTNPKLHVGVFASPSNASIIRNDKHVDSIYVLHSNWIALAKEILKARRENYDVVLNFIFNRTTSAGILANIVAPHGHKVGQGAQKYGFYFNRLLELPRGKHHMVEVLMYFLDQVFKQSFKDVETRFYINVDEKARSKVCDFLERNSLKRRNELGKEKKKYVVLNISASDEIRKISISQAQAIIDVVPNDCISLLIGSPDDWNIINKILKRNDATRCISYPEKGSATLLEIANVIEGAIFVITPDTSIVHFASAVQTPVIGLYTSLSFSNEWLPYAVANKILHAPEDQPVTSISQEQIREAITEFSLKYV